MSDTSKTWLVTGTARGLGRFISEAVLAAGDRLVAGARDPERLVDLVERYGDRIRPVALDVTDEVAARHAVDLALNAFGRLDVLVNNAGYGHTTPFAVVNLPRAVLPVRREQPAGHIFQVSSAGGRTSTPGLSAYQAAKWAVGGFSDVLAKEVAHLGIRVCTLEPGGMRTDWASEARRDVDGILPDYDQSVGKMLRLLEAYCGP